MADKNFTISGRLATIADVQRNFSWELLIPDIEKMTGYVIDMEGLIVRCKACVIPGVSIEKIEQYFMGTKQQFPGRVNFGQVMTLSIDETEDQIVHRAITAWMRKIIDWVPSSLNAGYSQSVNKAGLCTTGILKMYRYNGEKLQKDIAIKNMWPSNLPDLNLDMTGNEKVQYQPEFTYDWWEYA